MKKNRRNFHRFSSEIGVMILLISVFITSIGGVHTYADQMSITKSDLFFGYPWYLRETTPFVEDGLSSAFGILSETATDNEDIIMIQTLLGNFEDYAKDTISIILSSLLHGDDESQMDKKIDRKAAQLFLQSLSDDPSLSKTLSSSTKDAKNVTKWMKSLNGFLKVLHTEEIDDIKNNIKDMYSSGKLSQTEINEILKCLEETSEAYGKLVKAGKAFTDIVDFAATVALVESVDCEVLDYVIENVQDARLNDALQAYKSYRETHYATYLAEKYLGDAAIDKIWDCVDVVKATDFAFSTHHFSALYSILKFDAYVIGKCMEGITGIGEAEDFCVACNLYSYALEMKRAFGACVDELCSKPITMLDIEKYEMAYNTYIASVKAFILSVKSVDRSQTTEDWMNKRAKDLSDHATLDDAIEWAKKQAIKDQLKRRRADNPSKYHVFENINEEIHIYGPSEEISDNAVYLVDNHLFYGIEISGNNESYSTVVDFAVQDSITVGGSIRLQNYDTVFLNGFNNLEINSLVIDGVKKVTLNGDSLIVHGDVLLNDSGKYSYGDNTLRIPSLASIEVEGSITNPKGKSISISQEGTLSVEGDINSNGGIYISLEGNAVLQVNGEADGIGSIENECGSIDIDGGLTSNAVETGTGELNVRGDVAIETLIFSGGRVETGGNCNLQKLTMQDENDYLLVDGDFSIGNWRSNESDHLSAGTVEVKGNFSQTSDYCEDTGSYNRNYYETGTHKTILSGEQMQTVSILGPRTNTLINLYLTNTDINFATRMPYLRLEQDTPLTHTENLRIGRLELNGYALSTVGEASVDTIEEQGGSLNITGNAAIGTLRIDRESYIGGDVSITDLVFAGGSLETGGNCNLQKLTMQDENDYLLVDGDFSIGNWRSNESDHLSAGTVEVKGNFSQTSDYCEDTGYYNRNYYETGTHKTILSGEQMQTVSILGPRTNTLINLYLTNTDINFATRMPYLRLEQDTPLTHTENLRIGRLELNGYALSTVGEASVDTIEEQGGSLNITGNAAIGTLRIDRESYIGGDVSITDLVFAGGSLETGGNCNLQKLTMQDENDYLLVDGDFSIGNSTSNESDHLSAGTVEVKGNFSQTSDYCENTGYYNRNYYETGTHKTILSGEQIQTVSILGPRTNKFATLLLENETDEGVQMSSAIIVSILFDHKGNIFTLYNNGSGSFFTDYDGDTWTDEKDPHPTLIDPNDLLIDKTDISMLYGDTFTITAKALPEDTYYKDLVWSSDNDAVVIVDNSGLISTTGIGDAIISVRTLTGIVRYITIHVMADYVEPDFRIPVGVRKIESESFMGVSMTSVVCPDTLEEIASKAFSGCQQLRQIIIPETTTSIADDAFKGCNYLVIWGISGSSAEEFALRNGYPFVAQ